MTAETTQQGHFRKDLSMLCILSLLSGSGEMYGYELVKAMAERSEGKFDLPEGTIYPVLYWRNRAMSSSVLCASESA